MTFCSNFGRLRSQFLEDIRIQRSDSILGRYKNSHTVDSWMFGGWIPLFATDCFGAFLGCKPSPHQCSLFSRKRALGDQLGVAKTQGWPATSHLPPVAWVVGRTWLGFSHYSLQKIVSFPRILCLNPCPTHFLAALLLAKLITHTPLKSFLSIELELCHYSKAIHTASHIACKQETWMDWNFSDVFCCHRFGRVWWNKNHYWEEFQPMLSWWVT